MQPNILRLFSLASVLYLFWLGNSGHYTPFLLVLGAVCAIATAALTVWMNIDDREGHPVHLIFGAITYWPWLAWEIVKSGWSVTKIILSPRMPISPTMTRVRASQKSASGIATYGNSITLTPGTITTNVKGATLTVHALTTNGAVDVEEGSMDRRIVRFEGTSS